MDELMTGAMIVIGLTWSLAVIGLLYKWSADKERDQQQLKAMTNEPKWVAWVRRDDTMVTAWMPTYYGEDADMVRRFAVQEYPPAQFDLIVLKNREYPGVER